MIRKGSLDHRQLLELTDNVARAKAAAEELRQSAETADAYAKHSHDEYSRALAVLSRHEERLTAFAKGEPLPDPIDTEDSRA